MMAAKQNFDYYKDIDRSNDDVNSKNIQLIRDILRNRQQRKEQYSLSVEPEDVLFHLQQQLTELFDEIEQAQRECDDMNVFFLVFLPGWLLKLKTVCG